MSFQTEISWTCPFVPQPKIRPRDIPSYRMVVTTIGYGSRVPRSTCGKMAVIPYAGFGIVLVGFFISVLTKRLKVNVAKCAGWYRAHASVIVKCDCELEKWNRNIKRKTFKKKL